MDREYYFYYLDYTKNVANENMQTFLDQEYNVVSVEPVSSTERQGYRHNHRLVRSVHSIFCMLIIEISQISLALEILPLIRNLLWIYAIFCLSLVCNVSSSTSTIFSKRSILIEPCLQKVYFKE